MPNTPLQDQVSAQLQDALAQLKALSASTQDPAVYEASTAGEVDVWSRLSEWDNIQLAVDTASMQKQANAVTASKADLDATLKKIAGAAAVIGDINTFIGAVDLLVKAAKLVV